MKHKPKKFIVGVSLALSTLVLAAPVHATPRSPSIDDPQLEDLRAFWKSHGVSEGSRERLIERMRSGIMPESFQPNGSATNSRVARRGLTSETTYVFNDGSIRIVQVQDLPGQIKHVMDVDDTGSLTAGRAGSTRASERSTANPTVISGCKVASGSGYSNYTNCLVRGTTGAITNWFYADWTLVAGSYNDQIRATRNAGQSCGWPWNCDTPTRTQFVTKETAYTTAGTTYRGRFASVFGSGTAYLNLYVGKNKYSATFVTP